MSTSSTGDVFLTLPGQGGQEVRYMTYTTRYSLLLKRFRHLKLLPALHYSSYVDNWKLVQAQAR